VIVYLGTSCSW